MGLIAADVGHHFRQVRSQPLSFLAAFVSQFTLVPSSLFNPADFGTAGIKSLLNVAEFVACLVSRLAKLCQLMLTG